MDDPLKPLLFLISVLLLEIMAYPIQEKGTKNEVLQTVRIKVEGEIGLATDVYLPAGENPFPTILIRSPYNKKNSSNDANKFTDLGIPIFETSNSKIAKQTIF